MKWLLTWFLNGHIHKWKIIRECRLQVTSDTGEHETGTRYVIQCETCGWIKKRDMA